MYDYFDLSKKCHMYGQVGWDSIKVQIDLF